MRPLCSPRQEIEQLFSAGYSGTVVDVAAQVGTTQDKARMTLTNLRNAGRVVAKAVADSGHARQRGRPRVIYALADRSTHAAHVQHLQAVLGAWRASSDESTKRG